MVLGTISLQKMAKIEHTILQIWSHWPKDRKEEVSEREREGNGFDGYHAIRI